MEREGAAAVVVEAHLLDLEMRVEHALELFVTEVLRRDEAERMADAADLALEGVNMVSSFVVAI